MSLKMLEMPSVMILERPVFSNTSLNLIEGFFSVEVSKAKEKEDTEKRVKSPKK